MSRVTLGLAEGRTEGLVASPRWGPSVPSSPHTPTQSSPVPGAGGSVQLGRQGCSRCPSEKNQATLCFLSGVRGRAPCLGSAQSPHPGHGPWLLLGALGGGSGEPGALRLGHGAGRGGGQEEEGVSRLLALLAGRALGTQGVPSPAPHGSAVVVGVVAGPARGRRRTAWVGDFHGVPLGPPSGKQRRPALFRPQSFVCDSYCR